MCVHVPCSRNNTLPSRYAAICSIKHTKLRPVARFRCRYWNTIHFATLYYTWLGWRDRGSGSACHKSNELTRRNIPASRVNLQEITEALNVRTAIQKAKGVDLRTRNRPTCNTVTVIWLGELNDTLFCTSDVVHYRELAICNRRNIHCSSLCGCHHGELGWHSAVPNQGDATTHNNKNNRVPCREFVADSTSGPMGTHCCTVLQNYFCGRFPR